MGAGLGAGRALAGWRDECACAQMGFVGPSVSSDCVRSLNYMWRCVCIRACVTRGLGDVFQGCRRQGPQRRALRGGWPPLRPFGRSVGAGWAVRTRIPKSRLY